ncbi:uncharacterized protein [Antedon mediterranea]|uniref:uncharacterized protein n=1 Tax=Antedon mediterranea TaxID=105859 RepID=UPI003AF648D4
MIFNLNDINPNDDINIEETKYYQINDFNLSFKNSIHANHFSILSLNCRSMVNKFDDILNLINSINHSFSIIALEETWISPNSTTSLYEIPKYTFIHKDRIGRRGGGVALYLSETLSYEMRNDLASILTEGESIFIDVKIENKTISYGVIYRPPDTNVQTFNNQLSIVMQMINKENKLAYITGDMNLDISQHMRDKNIESHLDNIQSQSFTFLINKPTRITENSASIIDNILYNSHLTNNINNGIIYSDISDHLPIFCINTSETHHYHNNVYCYKRENKQYNIDHFKHELANQQWQDVLESNDANKAYQHFSTTLQSLVNICFPIKKIKLKANKLQSPWITESIAKSIVTRNKLYSKYKRRPTNINKSKYTNYRNVLTNIIRKRKKEYYFNKFEKNKNNMKETWNAINQLLGRKKKSKLPSNLKHVTETYTNPETKSDAFNSYFINIGKQLADKINHDNNPAIDPTSYLTGNYLNSMYFRPTTEYEIMTYINKLETDKTPGHDDISAYYIKYNSVYLTKPILHLINVSLATGRFPDELKCAKTIPVFISGDRQNLNNYRPISILPCLSKIYERVVYDQTISYLNKYNIINQSQYGFRQKHSTAHALLHTL